MKPLHEIREQLAAQRADIETLRASFRATECAPIDTATAERRADALIAEAISKNPDPFAYFRNPENAYSIGTFDRLTAKSPFAAFARIAPEQLRAALLASVPAGGLTAVERDTRLAEIGSALHQVEIAEEITLRLIDDQTGGLEYRRQDARPDILLAPLAELRAATKAPSILAKAFRKTG